MVTFSELAKIDCSKHTEKKNGFTYLSWPFAHQMMAERDPEFDWNPIQYGDYGQPYLHTAAGAFVSVQVTFCGKTRQHTFPVLDYRNKPIMEPTSFDVNTSIMRCFVKCCALFGLGLYIYAGEDLPETDTAKKISAMPDPVTLTPQEELDVAHFYNSFIDLLNADITEEDKADKMFALRQEASENQLILLAVWDRMKSMPKERAAIKKYVDAANTRRKNAA